VACHQPIGSSLGLRSFVSSYTQEHRVSRATMPGLCHKSRHKIPEVKCSGYDRVGALFLT
jgi:hypothetical protein